MGSGKSTVGKILAETLDWKFVDLDELIKERSGHWAKDLFRFYGEDKFREIEASALNATFSMDNTVIATGGGVPCFYNNMDLMKEYGMVIYLKGAAPILAGRILNDKTNIRPIVLNVPADRLESFISEHLEKRDVHYSNADHTVDISDDPKMMADSIVQKIEKL